MTISIRNANPTTLREITRSIAQCTNSSLRATRARINYNVASPSDEIPLIIEGKIGDLPIELQIYDGVACGFMGTITHTTLSILVDHFGFDVNPGDIMTNKKVNSDGWVRLEYIKNNF